MELKTEALYMEEKKGPAITQVTFDETYHLPDYLPDFFSVILSRGDVRLDESKCGNGHIMVRGVLQFRVLYRTGQGEWKISSLEGEYPFQETLMLEEAGEFDMPQTEVFLEDLTVRMINARKLNIQALLEIHCTARTRLELQIPVGMEQEESCEHLYRKKEFLELCYRGEELCAMREEVRLPSNKPNIRQLLWQQAQLFGMNVRVAAGEVTVQGELQVFVIYLGMQEDRMQWAEMRVPYQCRLEIPEASPDMVSYLTADPGAIRCSVQADADGEERVILAEADIPIRMWLYRDISKNQLEDVYSLEKQLIPKRKPVKIRQLHMKNESQCRVNDTLQIKNTEEEVLQIGAGFGTVEPEHWEISPNGLMIEGTVRMQVFYMVSSDSAPVGAMESLVPFQCQMEMQDLDETCEIEIQTTLEHLSFLMKNASEIEVQAIINVSALVTKLKEEELISAIEEEAADAQADEKLPGIVGLILTGSSELWEFAKKYHTTVSAIRKTNELEEETELNGRKILVVKQVLDIG